MVPRHRAVLCLRQHPQLHTRRRRAARGGHRNVDNALRRFQYRITAGMPVEHHLGTVDVLADGEGQSLVAYSTEVTPDAIADLMGPSIEGGLQGLKAHLESGA